MNTRIKIAASGLLIAALAASATPAFATDTTTTTGKVAGHSRHADGMVRRGPLTALVTAGTITQLQADTVGSATRAAMNAAQSAHFTAGLAALVADNTITQAQADAINAAFAAAPAKGHHGRNGHGQGGRGGDRSKLGNAFTRGTTA